jgi:hypothetical protein
MPIISLAVYLLGWGAVPWKALYILMDFDISGAHVRQGS